MLFRSEKAEPFDEKKFFELYGFNLNMLMAAVYDFETSKIKITPPEYATLTIGDPIEQKMIEGNMLILEKEKATEKARKSSLFEEIKKHSNDLEFNLTEFCIESNLGFRVSGTDYYLLVINYGSFDDKFRKFPSKNKD